MTERAPDEFTYIVDDETLERFAESTPLSRLCWLEEMRTFSWNAVSNQTRARWRAARDRDRGLIDQAGRDSDRS